MPMFRGRRFDGSRACGGGNTEGKRENEQRWSRGLYPREFNEIGTLPACIFLMPHVLALILIESEIQGEAAHIGLNHPYRNFTGGPHVD